jgi:hypothetical protein
VVAQASSLLANFPSAPGDSERLQAEVIVTNTQGSQFSFSRDRSLACTYYSVPNGVMCRTQHCSPHKRLQLPPAFHTHPRAIRFLEQRVLTIIRPPAVTYLHRQLLFAQNPLLGAWGQGETGGDRGWCLLVVGKTPVGEGWSPNRCPKLKRRGSENICTWKQMQEHAHPGLKTLL